MQPPRTALEEPPASGSGARFAPELEFGFVASIGGATAAKVLRGFGKGSYIGLMSTHDSFAKSTQLLELTIGNLLLPTTGILIPKPKQLQSSLVMAL